MKCVELTELLGALADGEIHDAELRAQMQAHLAQCASCREEYALQVEVKGLLAGLGHEMPSPFLLTRVLGRLGSRRVPAFWNLRLAYAGAAAAFLVVLGAAGVLTVSHSQMLGVYKALPVPGAERGAFAPLPSILPDDEEVHYASFADLIERRHADARELLRARSQWEELDSIVRVLSSEDGEEAIYKDLPEPDEPAEEDENTG